MLSSLSLLFLSAAIVIAQDSPVSQSNAQPQAVKLSVLVTDKAGRIVTDLRQEDFLLSEDGKPQKSTFFSREDKPISFGLIVDATGSMRGQFASVIKVARDIINSIKPGDEAFLARLRDLKLDFLVDWTADKQQLLDPLAAMDVQGQGPLIDALYTSGEYLAKHRASASAPARRRALVIITDGLEKGSTHNLKQLQKFLNQEQIQILALSLFKGPPNAGIFGESDHEKANTFLKRIADDTDGRVFFSQSFAELQHAANEILDYQRSPYLIGYNSATPGAKNKVRVKLVDGPGRNKYSITARVLSN